VLFLIRPEWSYRLNADFEDHAEHEYMSCAQPDGLIAVRRGVRARPARPAGQHR
jgi:hypothetical protein